MPQPSLHRHSGEPLPAHARTLHAGRSQVGRSSAERAGSALGEVLGRRASADRDAAGRSLLLCLVRLHELGALSFTPGAAVHGDDVVAEPSTAGVVLGLVMARGADLPGGGRVVLDGGGTVVRGAALGTAPAYNMGSLSASERDAQ